MGTTSQGTTHLEGARTLVSLRGRFLRAAAERGDGAVAYALHVRKQLHMNAQQAPRRLSKIPVLLYRNSDALDRLPVLSAVYHSVWDRGA